MSVTDAADNVNVRFLFSWAQVRTEKNCLGNFEKSVIVVLEIKFVNGKQCFRKTSKRS